MRIGVGLYQKHSTWSLLFIRPNWQSASSLSSCLRWAKKSVVFNISMRIKSWSRLSCNFKASFLSFSTEKTKKRFIHWRYERKLEGFTIIIQRIQEFNNIFPVWYQIIKRGSQWLFTTNFTFQECFPTSKWTQPLHLHSLARPRPFADSLTDWNKN